MFIRFATAVFALILASSSMLLAAPQLSPKPQGAEIAFVSGLQKDLMGRFPTADDAQKAGYFRYTNEDHTGSISYANLQWSSADAQHPSQLWYDVHGNLLGADLSVLQSTSPDAPKLWGVGPKRWLKFGAHVHYVLTGADGKETYGATSVKKFAAAGGDISAPQAKTLVAMHIAKSESQVVHVFLFPAIWDLEVWVKDNPNGAFADMNPLVKPSANAEKSDDM